MGLTTAGAQAPFHIDIVAGVAGPLELASGVPITVQRAIDTIGTSDIVMVPSVLLDRRGWEKRALSPPSQMSTYQAVPIHPERMLVIIGSRDELVSSGASTTWDDMVLSTLSPATPARPARRWPSALFCSFNLDQHIPRDAPVGYWRDSLPVTHQKPEPRHAPDRRVAWPRCFFWQGTVLPPSLS